MLSALTWISTAILGLALGSFGTVLATRVPASESIVAPGSACRSCGTPLRGRDNIPVLSYVLLRGRCHACAARISPTYPLLELSTALLFCSAWLIGGATPEGAALAGIAVLGPPLFLIDLRHHRLPDVLVGATAAWLLGCAVAQGVIDGSAATPIRAVTAGLLCAVTLFALAIITRGGMGMGDVKLAGTLGMATELISWSAVMYGMIVAFLIGGVAAAILLLSGRAPKGTAIAFGPMLLTGAFVTVVLEALPVSLSW